MFVRLIVFFAFVFQDLIGLLFYPYKTMRRIVQRQYSELFYFFSFLFFFYFLLQEKVKPLRLNAFGSFFVFWFNLFLTCAFFYIFLKIFNRELKFKAVLAAYSATLFPTFVFFLFNLFSFYLFPPPRSLSILGFSFSFFYLVILSFVAIWKFVLVYLVLRFLGRIRFSLIILLFCLYFAVFSPYYLLLYNFKVIRLPFI